MLLLLPIKFEQGTSAEGYSVPMRDTFYALSFAKVQKKMKDDGQGMKIFFTGYKYAGDFPGCDATRVDFIGTRAYGHKDAYLLPATHVVFVHSSFACNCYMKTIVCNDV